MERGLKSSYRSQQVLIAILLLGSWNMLRAKTEKEEKPRKVEKWMVEGTLGALRDPNDDVKLLALQAMRPMTEYEAPQTAPAIAKLLRSSYSSELKTAALRAYAALSVPDEKLLPQIVELFKDPVESVRQAAVSAVGATGEAAQPYLPQIVELFKNPDGSVRQAAVRAVGAAGEAGMLYLPQIAELLKDPVESVRQAAVSAVVATGEAAKLYLPQIVELFKNPDKSVRQAVVIAVGEPYALDICIDGLNEVTSDTRASISHFAERYFRGNILMATQPIDWRPPATARVYGLQPLEHDQIAEFLRQREPFLPDDAILRGAAYNDAGECYLNEALRLDQSGETLHASMRILSNPMDLTIVGDMIARKQSPDIFHLQDQQYKMMADEFFAVNSEKPFPLEEFSEMVYQMRLEAQSEIPGERFGPELDWMDRFKMVVHRQELDGKRHWMFRHNKVMDFFIVQAFLGPENSRAVDHLADPRFRSVYFQLATLLPYDEALSLREKLVQYAADTKDHTVSDTFVQLLRRREATATAT